MLKQREPGISKSLASIWRSDLCFRHSLPYLTSIVSGAVWQLSLICKSGLTHLCSYRDKGCHMSQYWKFAVFMAFSPCQVKSVFWLHLVLVGWDAMQRMIKTVQWKWLKGIHWFFALRAAGKSRSSLPASPSNESPWDQLHIPPRKIA